MTELVTTISKGLLGEEFAGRKVLVTGSSRGIGAEVALKAAAEGARLAYMRHEQLVAGNPISQTRFTKIA